MHNAIGSKLLEMQAKGSKLTRSLSVLLLAPLTAVFGTIVRHPTGPSDQSDGRAAGFNSNKAAQWL
jgi:hypothetical protein